jgi:hypothetical protein
VLATDARITLDFVIGEHAKTTRAAAIAAARVFDWLCDGSMNRRSRELLFDGLAMLHLRFQTRENRRMHLADAAL